MKVWYCNHYAMPPGSGGAERPVRLAEALLAAGEEVLVVSAGRHHLYREIPDKVAVPGDYRVAEFEGIAFCRVGARSYRGNGMGRVGNMLDYARGLKRLAADVQSGKIEGPDVLVYSSPHPFAIPAALKLARASGARFVMEVRDIWPQSLIEVAGASPWHPLCLWAGWCVRAGYRAADAVIGVLPGIAAAVRKTGLEGDKVVTIANGVAKPTAAESDNDAVAGSVENPYATEFEAARQRGRFVVAYTGSLGVANDMDQVLDLAGVQDDAEAKIETPYHFFFIGEGVLADSLRQRVAAENIDFVSMLPAVEKRAIPAILRDADAAIVVWKKLDLYRYGVSPNKLFDYFGAGLPVVWVGETDPDPVADADAGWSVPPNDPPALHAVLKKAAVTPDGERSEMGQRGHAYVMEHHNWRQLGESFVELCRKVGEGAADRTGGTKQE